jgi:hypothetical protein
LITLISKDKSEKYFIQTCELWCLHWCVYIV